MGGIASWALTGLDKISTIQGHLFRKSFVHKDKKHNCIILPAFHPSSALEFRTPSNADLIIKVFKEARKITRKD
jgi:uracil-DNA glycosylase